MRKNLYEFCLLNVLIQAQSKKMIRTSAYILNVHMRPKVAVFDEDFVQGISKQRVFIYCFSNKFRQLTTQKEREQNKPQTKQTKNRIVRTIGGTPVGAIPSKAGNVNVKSVCTIHSIQRHAEENPPP